MREKTTSKLSTTAQKELTRLAGIVATSHEAIYSIDLEGYVITWNKGAEKLFGFTQKEVEGQKLQELTIPQERKMEFPKIVKLLLQKKDIPAFETVRRRKDGKLLDILFSLSYLTNNKGDVVGASIIARDVSEQRKTYAELENAHTILHHIIQNTPDAIYVKDKDGRYIMANTATSQSLGASSLILLGKTDKELLPSEMAEKIMKNDQMVLKGKKKKQIEEELLVDGEIHTFLSTKVPYFDSRKNIIGIIGVSKDITHIKERQKKRDDMIAIVSHELKTPLTSISLYSQELKKQLNAGRSQKYADKIFSQTKRLNGFIHDLLDVARIESHTFDLKWEEFILKDMVDEIVESVHLEYPTHTIRIKGKYHYPIRADKVRFSQVVINLLTNAIKYSPQADKIDLDITIENNTLLLTVRDYGIGIPKEYQKHIFDKYFRVKNKNAPGTGLGLHIVSQIVKLHGGKIWIESVAQKGSTFFVSLPLRKK